MIWLQPTKPQHLLLLIFLPVTFHSVVSSTVGLVSPKRTYTLFRLRSLSIDSLISEIFFSTKPYLLDCCPHITSTELLGLSKETPQE